jgi:hypothetical protein
VGANLGKQPGVAVGEALSDRGQDLPIVPHARHFVGQVVKSPADIGEIGAFAAHRKKIRDMSHAR